MMRDTGRVAGTQSLERALRLLREVASHGESGARLADLVTDTALPKATVRRLLAAMVHERVLEQDEVTRRYRLGEEIFVLGTLAAARFGANRLDGGAIGRLAALWRDKYAGREVPLAALLCDRHVEISRGSAVALVYENAAGHASRLTYAELQVHSQRLAAVFRSLGIGKGDRVATLLPKGPELLITLLALWRLGAVHVPLFTAFGTPAVLYRLDHSDARAVVTNGSFRGKIAGERKAGLRVVVVESEGSSTADPSDVLFWSSLHAVAPLAEVASMAGDDPFLLLYSSRTAAAPQGVPVPVRSLAAIEANMHFALDLRDDDVYWHIADPGWGGGLYFAILGPLLLGRSTVLCDGPFDAGQVYRVLAKYGVTNLLAAPSWYRTLRNAERTHPPPTGLRLRVASSLGDRLPQELVEWFGAHFDAPLHDMYGQVEIGLVAASHHAPALRRAPRPGAVGHAAPGFRLVVLDADGREARFGQEGQLAVDVEKSPLFWFTGYYNDSAATAERFRLGRRYYLTGDLGRLDDEGYFYHLGALPDAGGRAAYRIGPAEVENALNRHPAIAEAAVVRKPDRLLGEILKVFVALRDGIRSSPELADEIARQIKTRLPSYAYAPDIEFVMTLPRTADGRLHRVALLRNIGGS